MPAFTDVDPARFIADFFTSFNQHLLAGDEDAAVVVDRFHTPDIMQVADGHRMDRDKLIAHTRPVRKNRSTNHIDVHEAIADNDRIAARYTLHVQQRGKELAIEVCFFGRFTPDGRMRQAHMLTRTTATDNQHQQGVRP
ncbi:nuclear transport factor 2 family protein [Nocardia cyriacigeorgica]|uniref:nuclear transport factor 2 family protein n=1 Tax=Nocardia cyriacigeorgica TaxID=135487 RepID=UPI0018950F98|nr:nuclear transport factor 2 family protein [Nocardia cyriacigeorgica]MBF6097701.1 nuclear transport factor 2 family protein [Nocardia cyriacigeorgica]MBF6161656.1 nuclear transport factor 2 family protein [Nocardia cyriacigeorgica]MBF6200454.1 nuclear transport factor 2 family protein [Nocardia cyriacigeorgica]MBF6342082.1 nuclear transport factor 2 family protein [Nocardia cyriacigeorgica]MBF6512954.1 nuclear transport factor 2 family protein [Nocardia cyriacigeorgica]